MSETFAQKCERNARVQARYDELMREGRRGHYETMFRVVREEVERALTASSEASRPQTSAPGGEGTAQGGCTQDEMEASAVARGEELSGEIRSLIAVFPTERTPLTDEQIAAVCAPLGFAQLSPREVARAIERAHGIEGEQT